MMTRLESLRIRNQTGVNTDDQIVRLLELLEKGPPPDKEIHCVFLDQQTHRCTIYAIRPAVCRVFGSSSEKRLICPHDCKPDQPLTPQQTEALMSKIDQLGI